MRCYVILSRNESHSTGPSWLAYRQILIAVDIELLTIVQPRLLANAHVLPQKAKFAAPGILLALSVYRVTVSLTQRVRIQWVTVHCQLICQNDTTIYFVSSPSPLARSTMPLYSVWNFTGQLSKPRSTPHGGWIKLREHPRTSVLRLQLVCTKLNTHRTCLPDAATPSSFSISSGVNFFAAASAPSRLALMRAGVTDLGRVTMPFATR